MNEWGPCVSPRKQTGKACGWEDRGHPASNIIAQCLTKCGSLRLFLLKAVFPEKVQTS